MRFRLFRLSIVLAALFALTLSAQAATLTATDLTTAGVLAQPVAVAAGGDTVPNDGNSFLLVVNSSGANAYTLTIATPGTTHGEPIADRAVTIAVSSTYLIGPFPTDIYSDSGGYVSLSYTGSAPATDLKVKMFSIPR